MLVDTFKKRNKSHLAVDFVAYSKHGSLFFFLKTTTVRLQMKTETRMSQFQVAFLKNKTKSKLFDVTEKILSKLTIHFLRMASLAAFSSHYSTDSALRKFLMTYHLIFDWVLIAWCYCFLVPHRRLLHMLENCFCLAKTAHMAWITLKWGCVDSLSNYESERTSSESLMM